MSGTENILKTKICTKCNIEQELSEFYPVKSGLYGLSASCKECRKMYFRQRRINNPEKVKVQERQNYHKHKAKHKQRNCEYRQNNPNKYRQAILKHNYNLTIEQWDNMYILQGGCCAICGIHQSKINTRLLVDHNHETGITRGLLCHSCNMVIGFAHENIGVLKNTIKYLKET